MKKIAPLLIAAIAFVASVPVFADTPQAVQAGVLNDPAAASAVKELLACLKYKEMLNQIFQQMSKDVGGIRKMSFGAINQDPKLSEEQKKNAMAEAEKGIPDVATAILALSNDSNLDEELLRELVPVFTRHFSIAEIREMSAFYKTPLGARVLALPQLMGESLKISQKIVMPRVGKLIEQRAAPAGK